MDLCPSSIANFADISEAKVHTNTVDALELDHSEAVQLQSDLHYGLVVSTEFGLCVGRGVLNGLFWP